MWSAAKVWGADEHGAGDASVEVAELTVRACARIIFFRHSRAVTTAFVAAAGQRIPAVEWMQRVATRLRVRGMLPISGQLAYLGAL